MPHSVFISYSRRESPFVDVLLDALEAAGVDAWVDYRSLVPGKPWLNQILEGIRKAEVFLLVVSKESMSSANVALEIQHALEAQKRILLIVFEAVSLPPALQACEWIDFRSSFRQKKQELLERLDQPLPQSSPPQKGFKTSFTVWMTVIMSLLVIVISIPGWWTFFLPGLLIPLPVRILRREFNFYRVRFAVLVLPLILFMSWLFFNSYPTAYTLFSIAFLISLLLTPIFLLLLSSEGMRRWGKPIASAPKFAHPYQPENNEPLPVPFYIDYAPADKRYAEAIIKGLTQYGHPHVTDPAEAQANFVLISRYKNSTAIDPEQHVLYPVLIQETNIEDPNLQKIQWIDFRAGIRHLDRLARLLPEPEKLLAALGVAPITGQILYPRIIQILDYFLILLGFFSISVWIPILLELGRQILQLDNRVSFFITNAIFSALTFAIIFFIRRALIRREGRLASLGWLIAALFWIGVIVFSQSFYMIANIANAAAILNTHDMHGSVSTFLPCSCTLGVMLISLFSLWNWRDLTRWFPAR